MDIMQLQEGIIVRGQRVDSTAQRERVRQRRLLRLLIVLSLPLAWFWVRQLQGNPIDPGLPDLDPTRPGPMG
ncbi:MAG: hypothetical protein AAB131_07775, partial [Actinomycetota bacterium]